MALRIRDYPVETVKYLVDVKVEWLDGKDTDGNGPLHLAVLTESLDLCRLITQYVPRRSLSCEIKRARRPSSWLPKLASPTSSFTCPPLCHRRRTEWSNCPEEDLTGLAPCTWSFFGEKFMNIFFPSNGIIISHSGMIWLQSQTLTGSVKPWIRFMPLNILTSEIVLHSDCTVNKIRKC